jgi:hypothetical protein
LLLASGGELSGARAAEVGDHLADCLSCRGRKASLEQTLADAVEAHHSEFDPRVPSMAQSESLLGARLARERAEPCQVAVWPRQRLAWAAAVFLLVGMGAMLAIWPGRRPRTPEAEFAPNAVLTPGAVQPVSWEAVCSLEDRGAPGPAIPATVAQEVFRRYGIRNPRPRSYEVDYLIPPALGGSEDPRNLWPQPYSAGVWNARVKDALEDRLRSLVCEGKLDLGTAQRDLARDWIAAYQKYFRTGTPLLDHVAFVKDRPWE